MYKLFHYRPNSGAGSMMTHLRDDLDTAQKTYWAMRTKKFNAGLRLVKSTDVNGSKTHLWSDGSWIQLVKVA